MRDFRLPRALMGDSQSPILLAAGSRLEALRLLPLLRALRAPGNEPGALLIDTGESAGEVREALREHGVAADLRVAPASSTTGMALAMARLCSRVRPSLIVAGGASRSGLAVALGARGAGVGSALLVSSIDPCTRWRWRLLGALHTWFYLARERPGLTLPRGRAVDVGDPLFDLCREQSEALGAVSEGSAPRAVLHWGRMPAEAQAQVDGWLRTQRHLRLDWVGAPPQAEETSTPDNLRRLGWMPHWRVLGLLRRAQVVLTDSELIAAEARWLGKSVLWLGSAPLPAGAAIASGPDALAASLSGALSPRPLVEDGRAAPRLAAHLLDSVEQRAFAGLLTRVHR